MLPLLLIFVVCSLAGEPGDPPLFVVPANGNYSWKPIPVTQLRCPPRYINKSVDKLATHTVTTVRFDYAYTSDSTIPGNLCHKVEWAVLCSTNFLGQHTYQYALTPQKVSEIECKEAVLQYSDAEITPPHFPSPDCGWMRDVWTESSFVEIVPHNVHYDPYTGYLLDPQFVGGRCKSSPCLCIHNGTIWLGGQKEPQLCQRQVESTATLAYDPKGKTKDMTLFGTETRPVSLGQACRLNFCEREGLRLESGDFIQIKIPNSLLLHNRINLYAKKCDPGVTVGLHSRVTHDRGVDLALIDEQDRLTCIQTSLIIMSTNKISSAELSNFTPRYPGNGYAYRLNQNQLESALVHYVGVYRVPSNSSDPTLIGYSMNGTSIIWTDWVKPNSSTPYLAGPNGILRSPRGRIILPHLEAVYQYYDLAITLAHDIHPIAHPGVRIISNFTDALPIVHRPGGQDGSVGDLMSELFGGIGGKIGGFLVGVIVIILLVFVIKTLLARCLRGTTGPAPVPTRLVRRASSRWRNYGNSPV